jgi:hypothetical protein
VLFALQPAVPVPAVEFSRHEFPAEADMDAVKFIAAIEEGTEIDEKCVIGITWHRELMWTTTALAFLADALDCLVFGRRRPVAAYGAGVSLQAIILHRPNTKLGAVLVTFLLLTTSGNRASS